MGTWGAQPSRALCAHVAEGGEGEVAQACALVYGCWWVLHVSLEARVWVSVALGCQPSPMKPLPVLLSLAPGFSVWGPSSCLRLLPGEEEEPELAAGVLCPRV